MVTGHLTCPRCGVDFTYTCDIEVRGAPRSANGITVDVTPVNIRHGHTCKTPESIAA